MKSAAATRMPAAVRAKRRTLRCAAGLAPARPAATMSTPASPANTSLPTHHGTSGGVSILISVAYARSVRSWLSPPLEAMSRAQYAPAATSPSVGLRQAAATQMASAVRKTIEPAEANRARPRSNSLCITRVRYSPSRASRPSTARAASRMRTVITARKETGRVRTVSSVLYWYSGRSRLAPRNARSIGPRSSSTRTAVCSNTMDVIAIIANSTSMVEATGATSIHAPRPAQIRAL